MMATKTLTGACLCGKITYAIDLPATEPNPKVLTHLAQLPHNQSF
jgi:hypothetical protein